MQIGRNPVDQEGAGSNAMAELIIEINEWVVMSRTGARPRKGSNKR
jgi:hypothetical protein